MSSDGDYPSNYAIGFVFNVDSRYYQNILSVEKNTIKLIEELDRALSIFSKKKRHSKTKIQSTISNFARSIASIPASAGLENAMKTACSQVLDNVLTRYYSYPGYHSGNPKDPDKYGWGRITEVLSDKGQMTEVRKYAEGGKVSSYFGGVGNLDVLERNTSKIFREHRWWNFQNRYPQYESGFTGRGALTGWWEFQEDLNFAIDRQFLINHETGLPYESDSDIFKTNVRQYILKRISSSVANAKSRLSG